MCGICGVIERNPKGAKIEAMLGSIKHRGPDDNGSFVWENGMIGMSRLSIIDIEKGKQPIESEDGNFVIVFNGEIYNYQELREDLIKEGYKFKTNSDTEVLLNLYIAKKEEMLPLLRGMFAFAIYDKNKNEIFIARDFFGIKPLYFLAEEGRVKSFASEIKSILAQNESKYAVNDSAVFNMLAFQYNPLTETFFKNIFKLAPGHYMKIDANTGKYEVSKYWEFNFGKDFEKDESSLKEELRDTLRDSVAHHMIADVPVGSFLSGGIDSSIIATLAREHKKEDKLLTFTIGAQEISEFSEARETADKLATEHTEVMLKEDRYFEELGNIAWHFDEPVADPSAIALYFLAEAASEKVKVVMSGEGSDELFGGYNIYREPFALEKVTKLPGIIKKPLFFLVNHIPFSFWGLNYLKRTAKSIEDRYIGNAHIFSKSEMQTVWKGDRQKEFSLATDFEKVSEETDSRKMQYIDINHWLIGDILAKADKMTMAHSLELRVPFLDKNIYEFARHIPEELKYKNGMTKYLLREAAHGLIPESTDKRKKLGFPVPLSAWLKEREDWTRIILENKLINKYFKKNHVEKLIKQHKKGKRDNARKLFIFLMLANWYNAFKANLEL